MFSRHLARRLAAVICLTWGCAILVLAATCFWLKWYAQIRLAITLGFGSLAISLVSLIPLRSRSGVKLLDTKQPSILTGAFISIGIRSGLTLLMVILLDVLSQGSRQVVGIWAIFWYVLLLLPELAVLGCFSVANRVPVQWLKEEPET